MRVVTRSLTAALFLAPFLAASLMPTARADVRLPHVMSDNMVLQRDIELPVWGWAAAGEAVTVTLGEHKATAKAGDDGKWQVRLPAMKAGGPHEMTIEGQNRIALKNILVGEVWVCSGQSNMAWPVSRSDNAEKEIAAAKFPQIRLFQIPRVPSIESADDVKAAWVECSPETVGSFSAVAYFFGRTLHEDLDVPVGLVNTSWGGTRIEPWTPPVGFRAVEAVADIAKQIETRGKDAKITHQSPAVLYNGMVHPIVPFAIRGAIWYQGESNRADGMLYHEKMKALIAGWRSVWKQDELPFLYVQLAPYKYDGNVEALAKLWEAQTATLGVKNTGMAVTTDIGNMGDIHPTNKQDVGQRLALWALAKTYGQKGVTYSGPMYKSMSVSDGTVRLTFDHAGDVLKSSDGEPLRWFAVAGDDGRFVPAKAEIDGEAVVVSSAEVPHPKAVRYGWTDHQSQPNLVNAAGLPAVPFRTDK